MNGEPEFPPLVPPTDAGQAPATAPPPTPSEKRTERAHPLTPLVRGWVVLLAIVLGVGREFVPDGSEEGGGLPPIQFLLIGIGVVALIAVIVGFMSWRFTRFVVDADELRIDAGAVFRTSKRIAFERVQAIDVVQPFAARIFGLAEIRIDIGGGESNQLRYLSLARAYELRDYLLARARGHRDARATPTAVSLGAALTDLTAEDQVLVRVQPATLVLAAVTSLEFFAILFGSAVAIIVTLAFDLGLAALGLLLPAGSALISFITRRVTGQFNYTLSRRPAGLRITRGLASLTSQSLPPRRVQAVQISQSLLWRRLGLFRIDLEVAGWGDIGENEEGKEINSIMLPAGTAEQVTIALAALWPTADYRQVPLSPTPPAARRLHPFSGPFLRWGFDDRLFVAQHGWLVRRWQVVPHSRAQSVRLRQGPFSRRLGLADIEIHTTGTQLSIHAEGTDASTVRARLADLEVYFQHPPAHDVSEPALPPVGPDQATGSAARLADQAEATISSTE